MAHGGIVDNFNNLKPIEKLILKVIYSEPTGLSKSQLIERIREAEDWPKDSIVSATSKLEVYEFININKRRNFHNYIINYKKLEQIKELFRMSPEEMKTALDMKK